VVPTDSALMNALATIKAVKRAQPNVAGGLLERGYDRVGLPRDASKSWLEQIVGLASGIRELDPTVAELSRQIKQLAPEELGESS
jgi:hypothetical protein